MATDAPTIDDPVVALLLSGKASAVEEAEELYLEHSLGPDGRKRPLRRGVPSPSAEPAAPRSWEPRFRGLARVSPDEQLAGRNRAPRGIATDAPPCSFLRTAAATGLAGAYPTRRRAMGACRRRHGDGRGAPLEAPKRRSLLIGKPQCAFFRRRGHGCRARDRQPSGGASRRPARTGPSPWCSASPPPARRRSTSHRWRIAPGQP